MVRPRRFDGLFQIWLRVLRVDKSQDERRMALRRMVYPQRLGLGRTQLEVVQVLKLPLLQEVQQEVNKLLTSNLGKRCRHAAAAAWCNFCTLDLWRSCEHRPNHMALHRLMVTSP